MRLKIKLCLIILYAVFIVSCDCFIDENNSEEESLKSLFMSGSDENNPLFPYRKDIPYSYVGLAKDILQGNHLTKASSHRKLEAFMQYIGEYKIGYPSDHSLYTVAKEKIGACGDFTNIFLALAATQGIKGRIISLGNYPENNGHAVAEVKIDGHWCIYDPTYGSYFTTTPNNKDNPYVLSFDELRNGRGDDGDVSHIVINDHRLTSANAYLFSGSQIYQYANPAGHLGDDKPFIYPLILSALGEHMIESKDFGADRQGIDFIGVADRNVYQDWTITDLSVGSSYEFIIDITGLGGEINKSDSLVAKATITGGELAYNATHEFFYDCPAANCWNIGFVANSNTAKILLSHNYIGKNYKFIYLKRLELIKK